MGKAILLKYTSDYVTPLLKIFQCLPRYEQYKPDPWRWSTGRKHSGLSDLSLTLPLTHFPPVSLNTVFSKHAQYSHTSALLHYLSPLTRTLLSLTSPWLIPSPPSDLCSSHHLNRQCSPTYLKWHFTPSPHTLNYLLSYSMFPPQHSSSPNILLIIFIKFIASVPH